MKTAGGVTFKGFEKGKKELLAKVGAEMAQRMDKAAAVVADAARDKAPVWRGIMKGDITYKVTAKGDVITAAIGVKKRSFWAWFVEMGTKHSKAEPFLRPALAESKTAIKSILRGK